MNATTITTADAVQPVIAEAAGHWDSARKVESDLPGVTYLSIGFPVFFGKQLIQCRVEVYSARPEFGSASVIIGGTGHLIVPTDEMTAAFTAHGCVDIFGN